jgi:hypothetical protein
MKRFTNICTFSNPIHRRFITAISVFVILFTCSALSACGRTDANAVLKPLQIFKTDESSTPASGGVTDEFATTETRLANGHNYETGDPVGFETKTNLPLAYYTANHISVGNYIIFNTERFPNTSSSLVIYNKSSRTFSTVTAPLAYYHKAYATVVGSKVMFPVEMTVHDKVVVYNSADNSFSTVTPNQSAIFASGTVIPNAANTGFKVIFARNYGNGTPVAGVNGGNNIARGAVVASVLNSTNIVSSQFTLGELASTSTAIPDGVYFARGVTVGTRAIFSMANATSDAAPSQQFVEYNSTDGSNGTFALKTLPNWVAYFNYAVAVGTKALVPMTRPGLNAVKYEMAIYDSVAGTCVAVTTNVQSTNYGASVTLGSGANARAITPTQYVSSAKATAVFIYNPTAANTENNWSTHFSHANPIPLAHYAYGAKYYNDSKILIPTSLGGATSVVVGDFTDLNVTGNAQTFWANKFTQKDAPRAFYSSDYAANLGNKIVFPTRVPITENTYATEETVVVFDTNSGNFTEVPAALNARYDLGIVAGSCIIYPTIDAMIPTTIYTPGVGADFPSSSIILYAA